MKIEMSVGPNGQIERKVDFEGASLPDGRNIDDVLNENKSLKKNVVELEEKVEKSSSFLTKLIRNKNIRDIIEIILFVSGIWGIMTLF